MISFSDNKFVNIKTKIFILICFWSFSLQLYGQDFPKFTFTRNHNTYSFPNKSLFHIMRDSKGFFWVSTYDGLCRWDGKNTKVYRTNTNDSNTILSNSVSMTTEDKEGNIWINHGMGISLLKNNTFTNFEYKYNDTTSNPFGYVRLAPNGEVFIASSDLKSLYKLNPQNAKFENTGLKGNPDDDTHPKFSKDIIGHLSEPQWDGSIYLYSIHGLFKFDPNTNNRQRIVKSDAYEVLYLFKDHQGLIWYGEWNGGLSIINEITKEKINVFNNKRVSHITELKDHKGKYWILCSESTTGSIYIVDPVTKKYTSQVLTIDNETNSTLYPGFLLQGYDGSIYITSAEGLLEAKPLRQAITNEYVYERGKPFDIFYDGLVRCGLQMANGNSIFGILGFNGIRVYDKNYKLTKTIKKYSFQGKQYDLDVREMLEIAPNKVVLLGASGMALYENDKITPVHYSPKSMEFPNNEINVLRNMVSINSDEYWIRTNEGQIRKYNLKAKTFSPIRLHADLDKKKELPSLLNLTKDKEGNIWTLSNFQIFKYDSLKNIFIHQSHINANNKKVKAIYDIFFDDFGNLWITGEGGLICHHLSDQKEIHYSLANKLHTNITRKITQDHQKNLWVLTSIGLTQINPKTGMVKHLTCEDGLPLSTTENSVPFFVDSINTLNVGYTGVITRISIDQFNVIPTIKPTVVISEVEGNGGSLVYKINENSQKTIDLSFEDFPVNILFNIIDYTTKADRKYFYRYTGGDTTWIECNEGIVPINTIEPGDYTVEVRGKVNSLFSNIDTVHFTIIAKWYQTSTFKYGSILGILSIISLLIRWRFKTEKEKQRQEIEIQRLAAEQYKNQYELSRISHYFSNSLKDINNENDVLWDVAKNLIGQLNYADCMIYLWNDDRSKLIQKAGYGPKGSIEEIDKQVFDVVLGQGVVGYVAETKESVLIKDTRLDARYRVDEMVRLSEICVPILLDGEVIGIIDAEHPEVDHFTQNDIQILSTIAANISVKLTELKTKTELESNKKELATTIEDLKGAQLDALRSQMNPHFIFNSLNSIENFILKNEKIIASEYLGKFSKLIRNILDNSKSEQIPIAKEIETLKLYIELERLRTGDAFDVLYDIPDDIIEDNINIPPMLMQPHVENAILHGIKHLEDKRGRLNISMTINNNDYLEYTLQDNGIGRAKSKAQKTYRNHEHKSYGIDITQNRIDLYNQRNNIEITFFVEDLYDSNLIACGTKVVVLIPII